MADETTNTTAQGAETTQEPDHEGQGSGGVRTFTQEQLDAIVSDRLARDRRERKNTIDTLTRERDEALAEAQQLRRERFLLDRGVPAGELDFYLFQTEKRTAEDGDFEAAAEEYLREHPRRRGPGTVRVDTAAPLGGGGRVPGPNDTMNALIRGARK